MQDSSDLDAVVSDFGEDVSVLGEAEQTPLQGDIILLEQENGSTEISVTLVEQTDSFSQAEPPRKRPRTDGLPSTTSTFVDSSSTVSGPVMTSSSENPTFYERDAKFYIPEADCVIRVEKTLFRVHRFILARDASAFEHMFSVSSGENDQGSLEGSLDERPIVLYDETAEKFRVLLTIMYALPTEIQQYTTADAPVPTLLTIAEITNKYHFASTASWAITALYDVFKAGEATNQWNPTLCRSSLFQRVIQVAILCGHTELCDFAVDKWIDRIMNRSANPILAMSVADKFGLTKLAGVSYYVALLECGPQLQWSNATFGDIDQDLEEASSGGSSAGGEADANEEKKAKTPPPQLNAAQKVRLLSGFFSLVRYWEQVRSTPSSFARPAGCTYHAHGCLSTWHHTWISVAQVAGSMKFSPADVIGKMNWMYDQFSADGEIACALTPACRRMALACLKQAIKLTQDDLATHFRDLTGGIHTDKA